MLYVFSRNAQFSAFLTREQFNKKYLRFSIEYDNMNINTKETAKGETEWENKTQ